MKHGSDTSRTPVKETRQERALRKKQQRLEKHQDYVRYIKHKAKEKPKVLVVYVVLRLLILVELVRSAWVGHFYSVFMCVLVLLLLMLPSLFERKLYIELPSVLETIVVLFVFAAEFLGEVGAFYVKVPYWDTMLHTLWGFLCAAVGFALVDFLNRSSNTRIQLTPLYMAVTAVTFSVAVSACWEIFEYSMDNLLGVDMQKDEIVTSFGSVWLDETMSNEVVSVKDIASTTITLASGEEIVIEGGYLDIGIHDTMEDVIVNLIGALVFAVIGYAYVKTRDEKSIAARFIPHVLPMRDGKIVFDDEDKDETTPASLGIGEGNAPPEPADGEDGEVCAAAADAAQAATPAPQACATAPDTSPKA